MDALHNLNECFAIFYTRKEILIALLNVWYPPWYARDGAERGVGGRRALICMQISMYPISASEEEIFYSTIRERWL